MRVVAILLMFAAAFGLAALWQSRRVDRLHRESELARQLRDGALAETSSGLVPAGWGVVVVGRPSGAESIADGMAGAEATPAIESAPEAQDTPPSAPVAGVELPDFELELQPGQSLSEVAAEHYGTAARALVDALAAYNGLADPNRVTAGQRLRLPPIERLR